MRPSRGQPAKIGDCLGLLKERVTKWGDTLRVLERRGADAIKNRWYAVLRHRLQEGWRVLKGELRDIEQIHTMWLQGLRGGDPPGAR